MERREKARGEAGWDVCLVGATFATNNLGVNALTDGAIRCVLHDNPGARIWVLDYGRAATVYEYRRDDGRVGIPVEPMRFSKRLFLPNNIVVLLVLALAAHITRKTPFRRWFLRRSPILARLERTGFVAALSGGDSFSDIYGMWRFLYVSLPQVMVALSGVPLVLLPQTIGPFAHRPWRMVATWIVRKATVVYARDHAGVRYCDELVAGRNRHGRARFCYDLGFVVDAARGGVGYEAGKGVRTTVGVNVSGLLHMGGYTRRNMFGLGVDYRALMVAIVERFLAEEGVGVVFVPHVMGADNPESDVRACEAVMGEVAWSHGERVWIPRYPYDQRGAKGIVAGCDFFVGSRMHACIAALSQGVPAVGIAYSDKFAGVMESVGLGALAVDLRRESFVGVMSRVQAVFERRARVRAHLARTMPVVRSRVLGLFGDLRAAVGTE
jgi:polysaccharide pyruvyl transferase WcaK-like protein